MDPYQGDLVKMFMNVTGVSEAVAYQNLQAHGGDLNAAINNFYNEGENPIPHMQSSDTNRADWMEDDQPLPRQPNLPSIPPSFPLSSVPPWVNTLHGAGVEDTRAPYPSTRNTTSVVYQPRDVRAVPIDWRDEDEPRMRPHAGSGPLIEEIPAAEASQLPSQSHGCIIIDDEDVPSTASSVFRTGGEVGGRSPYGNTFTGDFPPGNSSLNTPLIDELPANDIEEEILRAVIEASRKEAEAATRRMMPDYTEDLSIDGGDEATMHTEEDDFARAVSLSLKTAEREKALRESRGSLAISEKELMQEEDVQDSLFEDGRKQDAFKRWGGSASTADNSRIHAGISSDSLLADNFNPKNPMIGGSSVLSSATEDVEELEEPPLVRRRSNRRLQPPPIDSAAPEQGLLGPHQDSTNGANITADDVQPSAPLQRNGDGFHNDEWGGISSEEQEEAVMLEAALFGSLPEDAALRFRYPAMHGIAGDSEEPLIDDTGTNSFPRPFPQPPSPTVVAQRRIREQQDDEYLASLEADREKEIKAKVEAETRRLKEAEAKAAANAAEKLRQEEELRKQFAEEELKKQSAAKRASLPEEPSGDDESSVTLLVRMPDGTRQGRRFRKSDTLQSLFDFIDVSGGALPGSYRLVRHPRQAFTDADHGHSFSDLGLTSKHEALFLELI